MPQSINTVSFTNDPILPIDGEANALELPVNLSPGLSLAAGTVLGQLTGGAVNDVQTFTATGTPDGGTFAFTVYSPLSGVSATLTMAFGETSTTLQAKLNAIFGAGNTVATGGAWPGTALVVTGAGALAGVPIMVALAGTNAFTGGSSPAASVAHTTVGHSAGCYAAFNEAVLAAPTAAPTASTNTGTATPPAAGNYIITYTFVNAQGETTASPTVQKVADATHDIIVASITFPTGATAINYYVNGYYAGQNTTAGTFVVNTAVLTAVRAPLVNGAYTAPNGAGTQYPGPILKHACTTDASGRIVRGVLSTGATVQNVVGLFGEQQAQTPAYFRGTFDGSKLTGLTANVFGQRGWSLMTGTTATPGYVRKA